jgi:hypothetical protein
MSSSLRAFHDGELSLPATVKNLRYERRNRDGFHRENLERNHQLLGARKETLEKLLAEMKADDLLDAAMQADHGADEVLDSLEAAIAGITDAHESISAKLNEQDGEDCW